METPKVFSFKTDSIEIKAEDGGEYIIGYISTHDRDRVNDVVTKDCMLDMLSQFQDGRIKLDFEHETLRGKDDLEKTLNITRLPLGKSVSAMYDGTGLAVKFMLNPEWKKFDQKGNVVMTIDNIKNNIKSKMLDAFSIAYLPIKTAVREAKDGVKERLLDKLNLINAALTGNAINISAKMLDVMLKSIDYMKDIESKPFAGYANFDDCVKKNQSKKDPEAYCASIMRKVEGKDSKGGIIMQDVKDQAENPPVDNASIQTSEPKKKDEPQNDPPASDGDGEGEEEKKDALTQDEIKEAKTLITDMKSFSEKMKSLEVKTDEIKGDEQVKELKDEIGKMNVQLKAFLESPQYKAVSEQMEKEIKGKTGIPKTTGPLDLI